MQFSKFFNPFVYYNIILLILFSLTVNYIESFSIINSISYSCLHLVIIYLSLYYFRKILYLVFFIIGLGTDLLLINQIGPHIFIFVFILFFFDRLKKYFIHLNSLKVYSFILIIHAFMVFFEMITSNLLFNYSFNTTAFVQLIFISLIFSFSIFLLFSKIDKIK